MPHQVEQIPLMSPGPGTRRSLTLHRFGAPGAGPKLYFHAALHADELPGTLVLNHLIGWLAEADARGEVAAEILVCPYANPVGLSHRVYGYHLGRYDLDGDGNFNRWYPDLTEKIARRIDNALTDDAEANRAVIREAARAALEAWPANGEANTLRKALMGLSLDADLVFDLHCHGEGVCYQYIPETWWPRYGDLAAELGCEAVLFFETDIGTTFDVAPVLFWHRLKDRFPDRAIPEPPFATTIELRGQADVSDALARQDARGLWRFLQRHGFVAGDPGPAPEPRCAPTPLAGADYLVAPVAGVLSYRVGLGERVRPGDVIADIVDPAEIDFDRARTPVATRAEGVLYGRATSRLVRPGESFAVIAGAEPLPAPDLPVIDH